MTTKTSSKTSQRYAPGLNVEIRDETWRVLRVDPSSHHHDALTVVGVSPLVRDHEAIFSTAYDKVKVLDPKETTLVTDDSSRYLATRLFMESMWRKMPPTDSRLHVGHLAAMDVLDYQLEPASQALGQMRQRILIADAVGLGKTLEAGILLSELIARGKGKRILVVALKSLLTQFQKEMWSRFTIPLVRLDSIGLQRVAREIPTNHNPFQHFDRAIISIDTLKQPRYRHYLEQARWDVVVIDEAHNVAERGHKGSARHKVARTLANQADSLIMLSATPHDGKAESFASLMDMLDPTAIANPSEYAKEDIKQLYVRRFKKDVVDQLKQRVKDRVVYQQYANASAAEEAAFDVFTGLKFTKLDQRQGAGLFKISLEKAMLSSPQACIDTIDERIRRLKARDNATEYEHDVDRLLDLRDALEAIAPEDFSKYQEMKAFVRKKLKWKPTKKDDRLVIFTERISTMHWLAEHLREDWGLDENRLVVLHGGMSDVDQQAVVESFGQEKSKVRVLVASDVAAEGINLHYQSHRMVHFDIPWSLMVFQQRNGRIDRYGQERQPEIVYMLTECANEDFKADQHILDILIEKDEQVQQNIGDPAAITGVTTVEEEEARTEAAIANKDAALLEQAPDTFDPFLAMLAGTAPAEPAIDASSGSSTPYIHESEVVSLFRDDYTYLCQALDQMNAVRAGAVDSIEAEDAARRISFRVPQDLMRRLKKLPRELQAATRKKDRIALTADRDAMQTAVKLARREESAWPEVQYLWRQHPVFEWVENRMLGIFGRHSAPVIESSTSLVPGEVVIVLSGLIPNLKSQPVLHRWFAVRFAPGEDRGKVEDFETFLEASRLREHAPANAGNELDTRRVKSVLGAAVERIEERMRVEQRTFKEQMDRELTERLEELSRLEERQLSVQTELFATRPEKLDQARRKTNARFEEYVSWVEQTLRTEPIPFIQVVAAIMHPSAG